MLADEEIKLINIIKYDINIHKMANLSLIIA